MLMYVILYYHSLGIALSLTEAHVRSVINGNCVDQVT